MIRDVNSFYYNFSFLYVKNHELPQAVTNWSNGCINYNICTSEYAKIFRKGYNSSQNATLIIFIMWSSYWIHKCLTASLLRFVFSWICRSTEIMKSSQQTLYQLPQQTVQLSNKKFDYISPQTKFVPYLLLPMDLTLLIYLSTWIPITWYIIPILASLTC